MFHNLPGPTKVFSFSYFLGILLHKLSQFIEIFFTMHTYTLIYIHFLTPTPHNLPIYGFMANGKLARKSKNRMTAAAAVAATAAPTPAATSSEDFPQCSYKVNIVLYLTVYAYIL